MEINFSLTDISLHRCMRTPMKRTPMTLLHLLFLVMLLKEFNIEKAVAKENASMMTF